MSTCVELQSSTRHHHSSTRRKFDRGCCVGEPGNDIIPRLCAPCAPVHEPCEITHRSLFLFFLALSPQKWSKPHLGTKVLRIRATRYRMHRFFSSGEFILVLIHSLVVALYTETAGCVSAAHTTRSNVTDAYKLILRQAGVLITVTTWKWKNSFSFSVYEGWNVYNNAMQKTRRNQRFAASFYTIAQRYNQESR